MPAMRRLARSLGPLLLLLLGPSPAAGQETCGMRLERPSDVVFADLDPFSGRQAVERLRLSVRQSAGNASCQAAVVFFSGAGTGGVRRLEGPGGGLDYEILETIAAAAPLADATAPRPDATLTLRPGGAGRRARARVFLVVPPRSGAGAGRYADTLEVRVFAVVPGQAPVLADRATLTLSATVATRAAVNLALAPQGFDAGRLNVELDFGTLERGESGTVFVQVRSSGDYRLSLGSEGSGALRRRERAGEAESVPYAARLDGSLLDLSAPGLPATLRGDGPTPGRGRAHELRVTIGEVRGRRAGLYTDRLRIRIEPLR